MKNKSLSIQIWITFSSVIIIISIVLISIFFIFMSHFLKEDVYKSIEEQQNEIWRQIEGGKNIPQDVEVYPLTKAQPYSKAIQSRVIIPSYKIEKSTYDLVKPMEKLIISQAVNQKSKEERYSKIIDGKNIMYVIRKENIDNKPVYLYSFVWDRYKSQIPKLLIYISLGVLGVIILSLWPIHYLCKCLTKPIIELETGAKKIATRDWSTPINSERKDEIGSLARSFEDMRQKLISRDEDQQAMLQYISHELKTPVMVIRSFVQSIKDGFYLKGNLEDTLEVIDNEAINLQNKVQDLLYITNLDHLSIHGLVQKNINLSKIIEDVLFRLRYKMDELNVSIDIEENIYMDGYPEQLKVVFENLIDNQMRYAEKEMRVTLKTHEKNISCTFFNDGKEIEKSEIKSIFKPFGKGLKGQTGLGLNIAYKIIKLHGGIIEICDIDRGALFKITLPYTS